MPSIFITVGSLQNFQVHVACGAFFNVAHAMQCSERFADSWVLVSAATGIFRYHGFFAVRPKQQEQEPFKLLHDAREEEEARVSGTYPQR